MARRFSPSQAPPNIADLIGSIVRDAQGAIQRGQQGRKDEEEALFQKAIDLAELELSREQTNIKRNPPQKPPSLDDRISAATEGMPLEELIKIQMRLTGKDQIKAKAKADAKVGQSSSAARAKEVAGFLKTRETSEVIGKKTITTQPQFTQATRDSINAIVTGQPFPVFDEAPPVSRETAGIPASAKAQITEGLKQIYGLDQWNKLTQAEKDAVILAQFKNPR